MGLAYKKQQASPEMGLSKESVQLKAEADG
jgi:hypothetical protein